MGAVVRITQPRPILGQAMLVSEGLVRDTATQSLAFLLQ